MTPFYAADIVSWRYQPPYDCYDLTRTDPEFLTSEEGGFFALVDAGELIGYRSFGADGQVPGGTYDAAALDTGGGLRPELTGKGLGRPAISTGLAFGRERFAPAAFRVTVATFNARALRVVQALGFSPVQDFLASTDGRGYRILVRPESAPTARSARLLPPAGEDAGGSGQPVRDRPMPERGERISEHAAAAKDHRQHEHDRGRRDAGQHGELPRVPTRPPDRAAAPTAYEDAATRDGEQRYRARRERTADAAQAEVQGREV